VTSNGPAEPRRGLATAVTRYGLARIALVAAIAALLVWAGVPVLVALPIAIVAGMPLSLLLLKPLRADLDEALAVSGARRSAHRARLRAELRGDASPSGTSEDVGEREPDGGADRPDQQHQDTLPEHRDQ
jgi:hypothetical protein